MATAKLVAHYSSSLEPSGPSAIAVDSTDDSLWAIDTYNMYHWAMNTTLLSDFEWALVAHQVAIDSQHRRLVLAAWDDGYDRLEWRGLADGALVQQFQFQTPMLPALWPSPRTMPSLSLSKLTMACGTSSALATTTAAPWQRSLCGNSSTAKHHWRLSDIDSSRTQWCFTDTVTCLKPARVVRTFNRRYPARSENDRVSGNKTNFCGHGMHVVKLGMLTPHRENS